MALISIDASGLRCPQPVLKVAAKSPEMNHGDIMEIIGDCPTLEKDIRAWCDRMKKVLLSIKNEGGGKLRIQIQF